MECVLIGGIRDVFITNFYNETNTLHRNIDGTLFEDRTSRMKLSSASLALLGFDTQFLDANLDGNPELEVANGRVDDLRRDGKPYHMPAQFFQLQNGVFEQSVPWEPGEYFLQDHLGRSVVCLDWSRDGQPDLAIGHLSEEYALLTNTCFLLP